MTPPDLDEMAVWAEADATSRRLRCWFWVGVFLFWAIVLLAALNIAQAQETGLKPDIHDRLPQKADAKRDCRVIIGRGIYFAKTPDGKIVPLAVLMSIRTRC